MTATSRRFHIILAAITVLFVLPAAASAAWNGNGANGSAAAKARSLAAGNQPAATVSNRSVTVSWTATGGNVPVTGYVVKRFSAGGAEQTVGSACSGIVTGTSCTEANVAPGDWRYSITPARQSWRGTESPKSTAVTVNSPALALSPTTVASLPTTLTGQITNYKPGQAVTFRLNDQTTGQILTGSITPTPVPANGTADVSVTLPNGVSNGSHTIHAIGDAGDVASANVTVASPTTISTSAYNLRDASNGTEVDASNPASFADALNFSSPAWGPSFSATSYLDFALGSPLRDGSAVTSASLAFRFANAASAQGCFYVEVRRASTNALVSTSGSAASPYCVSGTSQTTTDVELNGVTSGTIANDLKLRVYGRSSTSQAFVVDQATGSVTGNDGTFTLHPERLIVGTGGSEFPFAWSLSFDDDDPFENTTAWGSTYSTSRYIKTTFPGYVPAGATIQSVSLTNVFRSDTSGRPVCNYVETFAGASSIGVHNIAGSDRVCSPSNVVDVTDTINLPEVDTVAEANSLSARIYYRRTGNATTTRTDQVRLSITYVK